MAARVRLLRRWLLALCCCCFGLLARTAHAQYDPCSLCFPGSILTNPDALLEEELLGVNATCAEAEALAQAGTYSPNGCALLMVAASQVCGCEEEPAAPTEAPVVVAPTVEPPVAAPTEAPAAVEPTEPAPTTDAPPTASPQVEAPPTVTGEILVRLQPVDGDLTELGEQGYTEGCTQFFGLELTDLTDVACSVVDSSLLEDTGAMRQLRRALQANATLEVRTQVSGTGSEPAEGIAGSLVAMVNDNEQAFLDALAAAGQDDSRLYFATVTSAVASDPGDGTAPAPPPTALPPTALPPTESGGGDDGDDKLSGGAIFGIIAAIAVSLYAIAYIMWKSGRDDKEDAALAKEANGEDDIGADEKARAVAVADGAAAGAAATPDTPQNGESSKKNLEENKSSPEGTTVTVGVAEDSSSNGPSNTEMETLTVMAPAGKLGIVLDTTLLGPMVNKVKPESPMAGKLFSGDVIVKIGDEETRAMNAAAINAIMIRTANDKRTLIVMRPALEKIGDDAPPPPTTADKVPPAAVVPAAATAAAVAATPTKKKSAMPPKKAPDIDAMEKHVIKAPAGKMGIVIDTSLEGPMIHSVKADGPMAGKLLPGDIIVKIGEESTRAMNSTAINALMVRTSAAERKLTIMRTPAASSPKKKAAPKPKTKSNAVVVPAMVSKFDMKVNAAAKHAKKGGESEENESGWSSEESEA